MVNSNIINNVLIVCDASLLLLCSTIQRVIHLTGEDPFGLTWITLLVGLFIIMLILKGHTGLRHKKFMRNLGKNILLICKVLQSFHRTIHRIKKSTARLCFISITSNIKYEGVNSPSYYKLSRSASYHYFYTFALAIKLHCLLNTAIHNFNAAM